jgi:hypothetical protein
VSFLACLNNLVRKTTEHSENLFVPRQVPRFFQWKVISYKYLSTPDIRNCVVVHSITRNCVLVLIITSLLLVHGTWLYFVCVFDVCKFECIFLFCFVFDIGAGRVINCNAVAGYIEYIVLRLHVSLTKDNNKFIHLSLKKTYWDLKFCIARVLTVKLYISII